MNSQFWWYVARSGGVVAWALATASVVWGLLLSSRVLGSTSEDRKLVDLHRFLGGLTVVFAVVHGVGLMLDDTMGLGMADILVPGASQRETVALAFGIVAFYLLIAVEVTSLVRHRVSEQMWRLVHYGSFAVFLFGTIHGLRVGTDVDNPLIWWPAAGASAAVVGLCAYRIFGRDNVTEEHQTEAAPPPPSSLLERTLSQLEQLDIDSYPAAVLPPSTAPVPTFTPLPQMGLRSTSVATRSATPDNPDSGDVGLPLFGRLSPQGPLDDPSLHRQPPAQSRAPFGEPSFDETESFVEQALPTRVPQRLAATTAPAAGLGSWAPSARAADADAGPPPPPTGALDPTTGEPDPQAYRKWLRDWLEYVESQP